MFEDESPGELGEDHRALREDNKEAHEVMAAQREEMRQREKKERMEMLEALMGGYQVEDLLESAVKVVAERKAKRKGKGTGKPAFPQVAAGNRVTKKEENLLDFFRHSKRGRKEEGKEKGKQGGDWMDVEEETKGEVNAAELAKAAFGEDGAGAAEAITDDHSMGEPEASTGEGGMLETLNEEGRGSAEMTDYLLGGISEGDWKEIPQSGKSVATNYSLEGVKKEDWQAATGVSSQADPISSFSSMPESMARTSTVQASQYSLKEVTEDDWKEAAENQTTCITSDHSREAPANAEGGGTDTGSSQGGGTSAAHRRQRLKLRDEAREQGKKAGKATLGSLQGMMEEARKERTEIFEEVIETIDTWAHDQGQGEKDLRARLERIEEHLAREKQTREENMRLQGENMRMQAEICRLQGAKEEMQWNEVYCFVRNRLEWGRDQEETEEKETRQRDTIHKAAEQAAEKWRMKKELPEGWGGFKE